MRVWSAWQIVHSLLCSHLPQVVEFQYEFGCSSRHEDWYVVLIECCVGPISLWYFLKQTNFFPCE
jgi:hypothetical protein